MEQLKSIKEQLVSCVQGQMGDLKQVNAKELGEVIDMIKDLAEAMYYCSVAEAMEEAKDNEEKRNTYYYMEKYLPYYPYDMRDEDYYKKGRMYYEENYPVSFHDEKEGKSGAKRRMYMESKQTHQDTSKKIQELEDYIKDLTSDMMEMIQDASPEEKAVLQKKVNTLAAKIQNV